MLIALWIVNGILAVAFVVGGLTLAIGSRERLLGMAMSWVDATPPRAPLVIGALEIRGALGLILPLATGIARILVPLAVLG